jgi:hypothetical protein
MSLISELLSENYRNDDELWKSLSEVSDGLCEDVDNRKFLYLDLLKRRDKNDLLEASNISSADTVLFKDSEFIFIEFKYIDRENFLEEKKKDLFLKQIDSVIFLLFLVHKLGFREIDRLIEGEPSFSFWLVYKVDNFRLAIRRHWHSLGLHNRYPFLFKKVIPVSCRNFISFLQGS